MEKTERQYTEENLGFYVRNYYMSALGLEGVERDVYAVVRSFSDNYPDGYAGNRKYLADMLCKSVSTVSRALAFLTEKGLILKRMIRVGSSDRPAYFTNYEREESMLSKYRADRKKAEAEAERKRAAKRREANQGISAQEIDAESASKRQAATASNGSPAAPEGKSEYVADRGTVSLSTETGIAADCAPDTSCAATTTASGITPVAASPAARTASASTSVMANSAADSSGDARHEADSPAAQEAKRAALRAYWTKDKLTPEQILEIALLRSYGDDL